MEKKPTVVEVPNLGIRWIELVDYQKYGEDFQGGN
jgi:hypothetical protein